MAVLTGAQLLEQARTFAKDIIEPYEVSDPLVYQFLNEAERELALVGRLLRNTVTYQIPKNTVWFELTTEPEVIEFKTAVLIDSSGTRYPLKIEGTNDANTVFSTHTDYGVTIGAAINAVGRPTHLFMGRRELEVQVFPIADAAYTIEATQLIYPEEEITPSSNPTIHPRFHASLAIGAAVRMLELAIQHEVPPSKVEAYNVLWQKALARAAQESGGLMRDYATVAFTNDYW